MLIFLIIPDKRGYRTFTRRAHPCINYLAGIQSWARNQFIPLHCKFIRLDKSRRYYRTTSHQLYSQRPITRLLIYNEIFYGHELSPSLSHKPLHRSRKLERVPWFFKRNGGLTCQSFTNLNNGPAFPYSIGNRTSPVSSRH